MGRQGNDDNNLEFSTEKRVPEEKRQAYAALLNWRATLSDSDQRVLSQARQADSSLPRLLSCERVLRLGTPVNHRTWRTSTPAAIDQTRATAKKLGLEN